jgi:acetylornithine deacetylase
VNSLVLNLPDLLAQLIEIPSVNPRFDASAAGGESQLTQWLSNFASAAAWKWALQPVHPGRANFIAYVPGERGDTQLWEVHQDTVSGQGMTVDPFRAERRAGRIYGRGACDVKGSMAAMLAALRAAEAAPAQDRPSILLACTVNEECGFTGARSLAELWRPDPVMASARGKSWNESRQLDTSGGLSLDEIIHARPVVALVAEPTELNVIISHRGVVRWQCVAHGRAAHSSRPEEGANAVYAMVHVVQAVEAYHRNVLAVRPHDDLCGPSTACVTTFHGGTGANTVPDRALIDIDRRLRPDESPDAAYRELVDFVSQSLHATDSRIEHEPPWMQSRGLARGDNVVWAEQLAAVARSMSVDSKLYGAPYGTNAASIATAGIPAIVCGPGSIAQAHTADESIAVEQLELGYEIYRRVAMGALTVAG